MTDFNLISNTVDVEMYGREYDAEGNLVLIDTPYAMGFEERREVRLPI